MFPCMTLNASLLALGLQGVKAFPACSSQALQQGVPMLPIIHLGVHTHACHHALTWPDGLHGLVLKVVTWQCKATIWHERARPLLVRSLVPLLGLALACMTCVDAFYSCLWPWGDLLGSLGVLPGSAPQKSPE